MDDTEIRFLDATKIDELLKIAITILKHGQLIETKFNNPLIPSGTATQNDKGYKC